MQPSDHMKGKIALVGVGDISSLAMKLAEMTGNEVVVLENEQAIKEYANLEPKTFKTTAPPLPYLEPEWCPKEKKAVHHNRSYPNRKKKGKKTHRKK